MVKMDDGGRADDEVGAADAHMEIMVRMTPAVMRWRRAEKTSWPVGTKYEDMVPPVSAMWKGGWA